MAHCQLAHAAMEIMQTLQTALKDRGVSSLSITLSLGIDNRSGMFDCKTPHRHRHDDAIDEIGAWLGWLQSQGVAKAALLGHSRSGNQAARFVLAHPDAPVAAVILVAPQVWNADITAQDYEKRYAKSLAVPLARAQQLVAEGKGNDLLEHVDFLFCPDTSVAAATFLSYYAPDERFDTPRLIPKIKPPVLVIAGSEDQVMKGLLDKVNPLVDGQRVQLRVVDGADHFFLDQYADEAADAIQVMLGGG